MHILTVPEAVIARGISQANEAGAKVKARDRACERGNQYSGLRASVRYRYPSTGSGRAQVQGEQYILTIYQ